MILPWKADGEGDGACAFTLREERGVLSAIVARTHTNDDLIFIVITDK